VGKIYRDANLLSENICLEAKYLIQGFARNALGANDSHIIGHSDIHKS
jgi:hypothetical protein